MSHAELECPTIFSDSTVIYSPLLYTHIHVMDATVASYRINGLY